VHFFTFVEAMIETNNPEIDVTELMKRVRAEASKIARRSRASAAEGDAPVLPPIPVLPPMPAVWIPQPGNPKKERLDDLLESARKKTEVSSIIPKFLRGIFRKQGGYNRAVLESLNVLAKNNFELNKKVGEISACLEQLNGWVLALTQHREVDANWMAAASAQIRKIAALEAELEAASSPADNDTAPVKNERELNEDLRQHLETLQTQAAATHAHVQTLQGQTDRLGVHVVNLQGIVDQRIGDDAGETLDTSFIKGELSEQRALLQRALAGEPTAARPEPASEVADSKNERVLDSFYLLFENRFRGSSTEVKKRLRFYLPFLTSAEAGTTRRPVLDLGCGRGEWLELLKENKLEGRGVDRNAGMIARCKERSLHAIQGDATEYMRSLPANSQGGVTGFHIIEHLPFAILMEFLGEARRVLQPGGIAIFESPNCKNLVVGATNFNIDPTHRNPVFPETAELMLQSHGFERVRIEYLSPVIDMNFDAGTKELEILKKMLCGPQDFAVIAYKPKAQ